MIFLSFTNRSKNCSILLVSTVSLLLTAAIPSFAQSTRPSIPAQGSEQNPLNLTVEQQKTIQQIVKSRQAEVADILTAQQRARLGALGNDRNSSQVFNLLDVTLEQRRQVLVVLQQAREQINALLTPQQRQQLKQLRAQVLSPEALLPETQAPFVTIQQFPIPVDNPPPSSPSSQNLSPGSLSPQNLPDSPSQNLPPLRSP